MNHPHAVPLLMGVTQVLMLSVIFFVSARIRRGLLFGVSVPVEFVSSEIAKRSLRTYHLCVVALGAIALAFTFAPSFRLHVFSTAAPVLFLTCCCMAAWVIQRHNILPYSNQRHPMEREAELKSSSGNLFVALSAAALLPLAAAALYLHSQLAALAAANPQPHSRYGYLLPQGVTPQPLPGFLPHHSGFTLWPGFALVLFMTINVAFLAWAPMAERQRARSTVLPTLVAVAWAEAILFSVETLEPVFDAGRVADFGPVSVGTVAILVLGLAAWTLIRLMRSQSKDTWDSTPDSAWHGGGLFYYNPDDAAVLVPKRFGWGWTLNMARPAAQVYMVLVGLFLVGMVVLPSLLRHHR